MEQVEIELQRLLAAARGELDAVEAVGGEEGVEEKRKALYAEIRGLRERLEQAQFDFAFVQQRLIAAESGTEAAREFPVRIFTTV